MPSAFPLRPVVVLLSVAAAGATACLSNSSDSSPGVHLLDASFDGALSPITTGGNVGADGGAGTPDAAAPEAGASAAGGHQGFGLVSGGVRATSGAHVLVTTTGQTPGGNATMHSAGHKLVGGVVGGTQQP